jgi:phosphoribosylaminoimidazole carboxylase
MTDPIVGVIMGSQSDWPTMKNATSVLNEFKIPFEVRIVSAHRTPERLFRYGNQAKARGLKVIIAGAGGAAHLPGMVSSLTSLPVIGVPVKSSCLNGQDSLLSIVQMPKGIPVATVAIDNSYNAALLAIRMLGINDVKISIKHEEFLKNQEKKILDKIDTINTNGWNNL